MYNSFAYSHISVYRLLMKKSNLSSRYNLPKNHCQKRETMHVLGIELTTP